MQLMQLYSHQPTKKELADYTNAIIKINAYAYAITNQQLPILKYPPPHYGDFANTFTPAKQHAMDWSQSIFVTMIGLPKIIKEQAAGMFDMESTFIKAYLGVLIATPTDAKAKENLLKALSLIQTVIQQQVTSINGIEKNLNDFSTNIYKDAQLLTGIAQKALDGASTDQKEIKKILGDIESLKAQIKTAETLVLVSEIGIALSLFVFLIGLICCAFPGGQAVGAVVIAVSVAGAAGGIAGTVVENKRIPAMQDQIDKDHEKIDDTKKDIILLNAVSAQFNALYDANLEAQQVLTNIVAMWTNLHETIDAVKTELTHAGADTTSAQYQEAFDAFRTAESKWNEVVVFATALAAISYNWQDSDGKWHEYTDQSPQADKSTVVHIPSKIGKAA